MTVWHATAVISLDGMIARPDGGIDDWWLGAHPDDAAPGADFLASVDAILMGRATYETDLRYSVDGWLYPGLPAWVITSRPVPDPPPEAVLRDAPLAAVASEMEACGYRRVWVEGGGCLVRGMLELGKIDALDLTLLPVVLGSGIPLFPAGAPETRFRLQTAQTDARGAVRLRYLRAV